MTDLAGIQAAVAGSARELIASVVGELGALGPNQHTRLLRLHTPLGPDVLLAERATILESFSPGTACLPAGAASHTAPGHAAGFGIDLLAVSLRTDLHDLMAAALVAGDEALRDAGDDYVISGERNLLEVEELSSNMKRLRELFDLFEQRTALMQLLDISQRADGIQIFIGGESGLAPLDECSVVAAPYEVDGQVVGSVGVIGPTRMAYERVIPIIDITARLLSSALTQRGT